MTVPADKTSAVVAFLRGDPAVTGVSLMPNALLEPPGDVVEADVAREAVNGVIERLKELDVHHDGTIQIQPVTAWLSRSGLAAERTAPGAAADSVVWADVTSRAYQESELNWTYLTFMVLATLIASIAIVLDSQILIIGAMVLGPEFIPVAALGVALVRRRYTLFWVALRTLLVGFAAAIAVVTAAALVARGIGWINLADVTGPRPGTAFVYSPDKWSFVVAVVAAVAGVLSLTSAKVSGLSGVFISVTTIPAAGNIALGLAFGVAHEVWGSATQLLVNLAGMAIAGWMTLAFQQWIWRRRRR